MDISHYLNGGEDLRWVDLIGTDASLQMKFPTPEEIDEISRQNNRFGGRRGEVNLSPKSQVEIMDKMIVDWRNVKNGNEIIKCTKENKIKLDKTWMLFRKTWLDALADHMDGIQVGNEEEVKN